MKYSLRQLQLGYMAVTMKEVKEEEQCMYCWKSGCGCTENTVKNDPFINLTAEEIYNV